MIVYPLDFHRRAEQKWARRLTKSVRTLVARGGNRVCEPDALADRMRPRATQPSGVWPGLIATPTHFPSTHSGEVSPAPTPVKYVNA